MGIFPAILSSFAILDANSAYPPMATESRCQLMSESVQVEGECRFSRGSIPKGAPCPLSLYPLGIVSALSDYAVKALPVL